MSKAALLAVGALTLTVMLSAATAAAPQPKNVLGGELDRCCLKPRTGFYRDGFCLTGEEDVGTHTVCGVVTDEFLSFSKWKGNDLTTPSPANDFPGLKGGDKWCLCALGWKEAFQRGVTPRVILAATHKRTLDFIGKNDLTKYSST